MVRVIGTIAPVVRSVDHDNPVHDGVFVLHDAVPAGARTQGEVGPEGGGEF